ncbi:MAG: hypothetical protein ACHQ4J_08230 [Candidatus Binatia bacterium]
MRQAFTAMKIARKRAPPDEIVREPDAAAANHFNSGTKLLAILGPYKCGADLLDDQKNSLLERAKRRVDEPFSALDEGNLCIEDEIVRDETTSAPVDLAIFVDERTGGSTGE